jgi:hypothetical protein
MKLGLWSLQVSLLGNVRAAYEVTMTAFDSHLGENPHPEKISNSHLEPRTQTSNKCLCLARVVTSHLPTLKFVDVTCTMH